MLHVAVPPMQRRMKDVLKVKVNRINHRKIGKSIERYADLVLFGFDAFDDVINHRLIENAAWSPDKWVKMFMKLNPVT